MTSSLARQGLETLAEIKVQHTVFALPFALAGAMLAMRGRGLGNAELAWKLAWIVVAMAAARTAAMAFNRLVDARFDARNPRTAGRALPAGRISRRFLILFVTCAGLVFVAATAQLNPLCLALSPAALALVLGYSYTKRFTALSHLVLGAALGVAPAAAWIAVRGTLDAEILPLAAAVTLWTAGFDIIYACQDAEFDRRAGLRSLPARLGIRPALRISRLFHGGMVALLLGAWRQFELGLLGLLGVGAVAALLIYEHALVRGGDLSRVDAAFFAVNGWVSLLFLAFWGGDLWIAALHSG